MLPQRARSPSGSSADDEPIWTEQSGNDIITGDENKMIYPKRNITKAEAAAFISKVSKLSNEWFIHYEPYSKVTANKK